MDCEYGSSAIKKLKGKKRAAIDSKESFPLSRELAGLRLGLDQDSGVNRVFFKETEQGWGPIHVGSEVARKLDQRQFYA